MPIQRTLALIKPDAVISGNIGKIITMIENKGFKIIHARLFKFTEKSLTQFYRDEINKPGFEKLKKYMLSDKVLGMVLEKENAIEDFIKLMGDNDPKKAKRGTIRKKFGIDSIKNSIHGSKNEEKAKKEITYIFGEFSSIPSSNKTVGKEY